MSIKNKKKSRLKYVFFIYKYYLLKWTDSNLFEEYNNDFLNTEEEDYLKQLFSDLNKFESIIKKSLNKNWSWSRINNLEKAIMINALHEYINCSKDYPLVVNEAIEISKIYCDEKSYKLINKVLENIKENL